MERSLISDGGIEEIENEVDIAMLTVQINQLLSKCQPREKRILELYYGLNGESSHTLDGIAIIFHLTRERIRQIKARTLRRLRHPTNARKLVGYLE